MDIIDDILEAGTEKPAAGQNANDGIVKFIYTVHLSNVAIHLGFDGKFYRLDIMNGGKEQDLDLRVVSLEPFQNFNAVESGNNDVEDDQIGIGFDALLDSNLAVATCAYDFNVGNVSQEIK